MAETLKKFIETEFQFERKKQSKEDKKMYQFDYTEIDENGNKQPKTTKNQKKNHLHTQIEHHTANQ